MEGKKGQAVNVQILTQSVSFLTLEKNEEQSG